MYMYVHVGVTYICIYSYVHCVCTGTCSELEMNFLWSNLYIITKVLLETGEERGGGRRRRGKTFTHQDLQWHQICNMYMDVPV